MRKLRAILGVGLMAAGAYLASGSVADAQAQDGLIREGDLTEADYARPGSWEHVDELAVALEKLAQELHDEVHVHLEGHVYFPHMDGHAEEIEDLAEHIHGIAHQGGNIRHLREDVVELDQQVHHADEVITQIARYGVRAEHFDGAVRENRRIVKAMNAILHHLEEDLTRLDPAYRQGLRHEAMRPGLDQEIRYRRPSEDYHDRYPRRGYDRYGYDQYEGQSGYGGPYQHHHH